MKAVMLMFDSLNRHMLSPYAADSWVRTPSFARLQRKALTFERSYVSSMPCMPARRDFHTGRPSFLHCPWGPLEPFDVSVPQMLRDAGVYTHLDTDHFHYFEDGGATYHGRYDSWTVSRGQEGDPHIGQVAEPHVPRHINGKSRRSDWVNREHQSADVPDSQAQTLAHGIAFLDRNASEDRWFLQIECFDPHEPFVSRPEFREQYPPAKTEALFDWPGYQKVTESPAEIEDLKMNYAALVSQCDDSLGQVLDAFDRHGLWDDTMLIVWTDHGFLLGEHECWAKNWPPLFEEVSHTPFFVWDPRPAADGVDIAGQRRSHLVQPALDLGPTLLSYFGLEIPPTVTGVDLQSLIRNDEAIRDAAVFGYFNHRLNVTDGRYVLYQLPVNAERDLFTYTLMPTALRGFKPGLEKATLAKPLPFSKGMPVLSLPVPPSDASSPGFAVTLLYDLHNDPQQQRPLDDESVRKKLLQLARKELVQADAPRELLERFGLG